LETAEELNGELWIPGNRSLINLNLARNKVGIDGVMEFIKAIEEQMKLATLMNKTSGIGLLRLSLQRNSFNSSDPNYIQLTETMVTRDPFYKSPPPQSPIPEAGKE